MPNKLIYSETNPLQFFIPDLVLDEKFNSKDFDDFVFPETIRSWEQQVGFCQPWQLTDSIPLQLITNVGPVKFILRDCKRNTLIDTIALTQKQESETEPGMFIYEMLHPLNIYQEGCYKGFLQFGVDPVVILIETGELEFAEKHENTLWMEYSHFETKEDIIYETGFKGTLRVPATIQYMGAKSKNTIYDDQVMDSTILRAQKYRTHKLMIGGAGWKGVPDYFADILAGALGCQDLKFDGKPYTAQSDLEPGGVENFPKRSWSCELRNRYTKGSKTIIDNTPINAQIAIAVAANLKGFGGSNTGDQTIVINVS